MIDLRKKTKIFIYVKSISVYICCIYARVSYIFVNENVFIQFFEVKHEQNLMIRSTFEKRKGLKRGGRIGGAYLHSESRVP